MNDLIHELSKIRDLEIKRNENLSYHTWYRAGGICRALLIPQTLEALKEILLLTHEKNVLTLILGSGSNVLVADDEFSGFIIKVNRLPQEIKDSGDSIFTTSGVGLSALIKKAIQEGWGGFERFVGIPGSVGGAIMMNAGTHLGEVKDILKSVTVLSYDNGRVGVNTFQKNQFVFNYRSNGFISKKSVIISSEWDKNLVNSAQLKSQITELLKRRNETQPTDLPSCGSVFKNPKHPKFARAWQVIDHLGLRGASCGGAQFSPKHCNFIVNLGGATAKDILSLIELAKKRALNELGIKLEEEVCIYSSIPPKNTGEQ